MLPVDPVGVPPFARVERGPRGLRFAPTVPPAGAAAAPPGPGRVHAAAPAALRQGVVVAEGKLVLGAGAGVAFSVAAPRMHVIHDRRPTGLDRVVGAAEANAGLLHGLDGWRAVVLPSLGDVAPDLGPGPVAIRADGRRIAVDVGGALEEHDIGAEGPVARHEGTASALAYASDGTLQVAAGAAVGPPGTPAAPGSAIVELQAAAAAPRLVARHADGTISVWETGASAPVASWPSPVAGTGTVALSRDGALVALGTPEAAEPVAALVAAADGSQIRRIEGARFIAPAPERDTFVVGGDWGCAWITPPEEDR